MVPKVREQKRHNFKTCSEQTSTYSATHRLAFASLNLGLAQACQLYRRQPPLAALVVNHLAAIPGFFIGKAMRRFALPCSMAAAMDGAL